MAYTPTTWTTGDTITASAMNKIENGIAGANNIAIVTLSSTGFSSGSKTFGYIVYGLYKNNRWEFINDSYETDSSFIPIYGYDTPSNQALGPILIPSGDIMYPFVVPSFNIGINATGDIDNASTILYFSYGSYVSAYKIRGSGNIEFVAL